MALQADIFSFGVIIWEVIAHETPIRARLRDLQVTLFTQPCSSQTVKSQLDQLTLRTAFPNAEDESTGTISAYIAVCISSQVLSRLRWTCTDSFLTHMHLISLMPAAHSVAASWHAWSAQCQF